MATSQDVNRATFLSQFRQIHATFYNWIPKHKYVKKYKDFKHFQYDTTLTKMNQNSTIFMKMKFMKMLVTFSRQRLKIRNQ